MPPFRFEEYTNRTAPTLIDLIRQGGQDRARAVELGGQNAATAELANGRANAQIASTIGNTLADLVQIPAQAKAMDLREKETALRTRQADEKAKQYQQKDLINKVMQVTGGDHEATLRELQQTDRGAAEMFSGQLHTARMAALDETSKTLDVTGKALNTARQLLPVRPTDPKDEAGQVIYRQQYKDALGGIQQIVGPELGKSLPDPADPELFTKVQQLEEWGMTQAQVLQQRRLALQIAQDGVRAQKEGRDADAYFTKSVGTYLATAQSQDEWTEALQNAKHMGASPETLAKFGEAWSPEAVQRASTLGEVKVNDVTPGSAEDAIVTWAREHKRPVASLSNKEKDAIRATHAAATREPKDGEATKTATLAQKSAAERWKQNELQQLEAEYRAGKTKTPFLNKMTDEMVTPPVMDEAELERRKAKIQASYLEQIGANATAQAAKPAAPKKAASLPDLTGLKPGLKRRFTEGPFAGQQWTLGPNGQPQQVK